MIRFRNPATQFNTQIHVLKALYQKYGFSYNFDLAEMATTIAEVKLITAHGFSGKRAIEASENKDKSRESTRMNIKMYAEVFRSLGWVTSVDNHRSYPLQFTYLGAHVAMAPIYDRQLFLQSVIGMNFPNEVIGVKFLEKTRFFKTVLNTFKDLGGVMYKQELNIGPMNINDTDLEEYQNMIHRLKGMRGNIKRLEEAYENLSKELKISEDAIDNNTRLPIALLKECGLITTVRLRDLYPPKSLTCMKLTEKGYELIDDLNKMKDLRLEEFYNYGIQEQNALIRIGTYRMLENGGYDISPFVKKVEEDEEFCANILKGKKLLFSPFQTLNKDRVNSALEINNFTQSQSIELDKVDNNKKVLASLGNINPPEVRLNIPADVNKENLNLEEDISFLNLVYALIEKDIDEDEIVNILFMKYSTTGKKEFYPLVTTLFKIMGFNCTTTADGLNATRWDALIKEPEKSIPIEIKSPAEENYLSLKAIKQALENKIVLLAREANATDKTVTSLAVGYYPPNARADVSRLIEDIKVTYNIKIAAIDLRTLLKIAISILIEKKGFDKEDIYSWEGIINGAITLS